MLSGGKNIFDLCPSAASVHLSSFAKEERCFVSPAVVIDRISFAQDVIRFSYRPYACDMHMTVCITIRLCIHLREMAHWVATFNRIAKKTLKIKNQSLSLYSEIEFGFDTQMG